MMYYPSVPPTKPFDYAAFVSELGLLIPDGQLFPYDVREATHPVFEKWKLRLEDYLRRMSDLGYEVNCDVSNRHFAATGMYEDSDAVFESDMVSTLQELELIVENFARYGDPGPTRSSKAMAVANALATPIPQPLLSPERVTIRWLLHNMSMAGWGTVGAFLLAAFTAGTYFGRLPMFQTSEGKAMPAQTIPPAVAASVRAASR